MNCLFCKFATGEIKPDIVYEDDVVMAFRDINPQAPVHVLVIPREHIEHAGKLEYAHDGLLGRMFAAAREVTRSEGIAESGFRLVLNAKEDGGQTVFHLHMHILGGRAMVWPPG